MGHRMYFLVLSVDKIPCVRIRDIEYILYVYLLRGSFQKSSNTRSGLKAKFVL